MKNKNLRLLLTDLDGTLLLNDHQTVSPRAIAALNALKAQGVTLCACTGRVGCLIPQEVLALGFDYAITSNGALCINLHTGEEIFSAYISVSAARYAWSLIAPLNPLTQWYVGNEILMDRANFNLWPQKLRPHWHRTYLGAGRGRIVENIEAYFLEGAPKLEKINLCERPQGTDTQVIAPLNATGLFEISSSLGRNLEITHINADKGRALLSLCHHLGINPADTLAFGDGGNDLQLLSTAGVGVAMGNAIDSLKQKADAITLTNEEDGLADYLEKWVL